MIELKCPFFCPLIYKEDMLLNIWYSLVITFLYALGRKSIYEHKRMLLIDCISFFNCSVNIICDVQSNPDGRITMPITFQYAFGFNNIICGYRYHLHRILCMPNITYNLKITLSNKITALEWTTNTTRTH